MIIEYGIMSNKWSVEADDKLICYATIILHLKDSVPMIALYEPRDIVKVDSWLFHPKPEDRLKEVFGQDPIKFIDEHIEEIKTAYETIKKLV